MQKYYYSAEIKKLKEAMDLRNMRIMQLESQVNHASEFLASRDSNTSNSPSNNSQGSMNLILSKLELLLAKTPQHLNNININTSSPRAGLGLESKQCQTDLSCNLCDNCARPNEPAEAPTLSSCNICEKTFKSKESLAMHHSIHIIDMDTQEETSTPFRCEKCACSFKSRGCLDDHLQSSHCNISELTSCDQCDSRANTEANLHVHLNSEHGEQQTEPTRI